MKTFLRQVGHVAGTFTTSDADDGDTASYEIYIKYGFSTICN